MNRWLLMALALTAGGVATAEVTCEQFPDADVVVVNDIERVRYASDGTSETAEECWEKILTEKGRRETSKLTLGYSRRYGSAGIAYVGVIDTNGTERVVDISATLSEASDNSSVPANIYDPLDRVLVAGIPGLQIGETLHYRTVRRTVRPRCRDQWADCSLLELDMPILKASYEVTAPASRPLRRVAVRNALGNVTESVTTNASGEIVYRFAATNSPQMFPEPEMPAFHTQVQRVLVSTAADWAEISRWYWNLCAEHLAKTNAAMVAKVEELKGANSEREALLRAVFKFVSQEVRYLGLTMEVESPGYAPHDVDITFDNRHGVCRDQAGLLVAMLNLAGFEAYPVLINVGAKLDPEVPQPFFNHAIVAVAEADGWRLMDPTNERTRELLPAYLGGRSYLVCRPEGEELRETPVVPAEKNTLTITTRGDLDRDGVLTLEHDFTFGGINDNLYRSLLGERRAENQRRFLADLVAGLSDSAELLGCRVEPEDMADMTVPVSVHLVTRWPEAVLKGETRRELALPWLSGRVGIANLILQGVTALAERKYPLELSTTARVLETIDLTLAGGAVGKTIALPEPVAIEGEGWRYRREFNRQGDALRAEREFALTQREFDPLAYAQLRDDLKAIEAAERIQCQFAFDPLAAAASAVKANVTETTLTDPYTWVTTNVEVREIRSHYGKKHFSELKFTTHPDWKRVEFLGGSVSNADGRVLTVTAKDLTELDCAWAAAAPRYPAGKTLIVNLPGVEIGSVLTYTTRTEVAASPLAFSRAYAFDVRNTPVEYLRVRVNDWHREAHALKCRREEKSSAPDWLWRDVEFVNYADWDAAAAKLRLASAVDKFVYAPAGRELNAIRDWMARNVRIAGPSLYEVPIEAQLTDPATVVAERYATRLDYMRTLCALLKGAGYDAELVFAADDANEPADLRRQMMGAERPTVIAFDLALCRVRVREGGFLGFGGRERQYYLGLENEWTPLGACALAHCDCFDPRRRKFDRVTVPDSELEPEAAVEMACEVREDGQADFRFTSAIYGAEVGTFRRYYAELLPEDRNRHYQELLGGVAEAAMPIGELETDLESYPAVRRFGCFVPDFATVTDDAITMELPGYDWALPELEPGRRETPFAVAACCGGAATDTIIFPRGYTAIEHLPENLVITNPVGGEPWLEQTVERRVEDETLIVTVSRRRLAREAHWYPADLAAAVRECQHRVSSRANNTLVVRRISP